VTSDGSCEWLFVIGPGRSGTTPARFLLNAHPKCFIMHEGLFVRQFLQAERTKRRVQIAHHDLIAPVEDGKPERHWVATKQYVWTPGVEDAPDAYGACLALRDTYPPVDVFGDKLPGANGDWRRITQLLPGSRFIVTLRDEAEILKSIERRAERDVRFKQIMAKRGDNAHHVQQSLKHAQDCAEATGACVVQGDDLDKHDVQRMLKHAGLDESMYHWDKAEIILSEGVRVS